MNDLSIRLPGRVVFGRAHFDDGRQAVNVAELMLPHPWEPHTLVALGMGSKLAGSPPWMADGTLPGVPFGSAVAATLPRSVMEDVLRGRGGRAFTEREVADFLRPVLDAVARSERILAGVPSPPSADPEYVRMSPVMLPHWVFIAGDDRAEPLYSGAVELLALRVFTPAEFAFVEVCGGRLRPMPGSTLAPTSAPLPDEERAAHWMRENVTKYIARQRDDRVTDCINATKVRKEAAVAGWNALPEAIKGSSRRPK